MSNIDQYYQRICLNGHQINGWYEVSKVKSDPEYCEKCGKEIIYTCLKCSNPIFVSRVSDSNLLIPHPVPRYCKFCSSPYPWTTLIISTISDIILLDDKMSEDNKNIMKTSIYDLISETPKLNLAIARTRRALEDSPEIIKNSLKETLVNVVSDKAIKAIFSD